MLSVSISDSCFLFYYFFFKQAMNSEIISMNNIPLTVLEYFNDYHYSSSDDSEVVEYAG